MRLIAYTRTSTDDQDLGLDAQRAQILRAAEYRHDEIVCTFSEQRSASNMDRPELYRALELLTAGEADGLIVAKLDRLSRSVIDFGTLMEWFKAADKTLVALDMDVDTSTATGGLVLNVMIAVAQWEREIIGERTAAALAARLERGAEPPRPVVPADIKARIEAMQASGVSLRGIADRLTDDQVPTVRGGQRWYASTVRSALGAERAPARKRTVVLPNPRPKTLA